MVYATVAAVVLLGIIAYRLTEVSQLCRNQEAARIRSDAMLTVQHPVVCAQACRSLIKEARESDRKFWASSEEIPENFDATDPKAIARLRDTFTLRLAASEAWWAVGDALSANLDATSGRMSLLDATESYRARRDAAPDWLSASSGVDYHIERLMRRRRMGTHPGDDLLANLDELSSTWTAAEEELLGEGVEKPEIVRRNETNPWMIT